jgi:hypothetical protein
MAKMTDCNRREFLCAGGTVLAGEALYRTAVASPGLMATPRRAAERKVPVIDCHSHVGISRAGPAVDLTDPYYTVGGEPERFIRHMQEAGIDRKVVFPVECTTFKEANEEVAEICRRYPDKFIGFAKHNPVTEKGQIRDLLFREVHELGLRGLKLHVEPSTEMLDVVRELGIPVLYHPRQVALYEDFVPAYPTINFILAHLGSDQSKDWREHLAGIELAKFYPNVYLDTSTVVLTRYLEKAVQELPAEKLIFGSDEPGVDCRLEIYKIRVLKLPREKEELILGGNMLRLLGGRL